MDKAKHNIGSLMTSAFVATPTPGLRRVAELKKRKPSARDVNGSRSASTYKPHQGTAAMARRRKQIERGMLKPDA